MSKSHNLARLVAETRGWTVKHWAVGSGVSGSDHYQLVDETGRGLGKPHIGEAHAWADAPNPLTWEVAGELLEEMAAEMSGRDVDMVFDYAPAYAQGNWRYRWDCHISHRTGEFPSWSVKASSPQLAIVLADLRWRGVSEERIREAMADAADYSE